MRGLGAGAPQGCRRASPRGAGGMVLKPWHSWWHLRSHGHLLTLRHTCALNMDITISHVYTHDHTPHVQAHTHAIYNTQACADTRTITRHSPHFPHLDTRVHSTHRRPHSPHHQHGVRPPHTTPPQTSPTPETRTRPPSRAGDRDISSQPASVDLGLQTAPGASGLPGSHLRLTR